MQGRVLAFLSRVETSRLCWTNNLVLRVMHPVYFWAKGKIFPQSIHTQPDENAIAFFTQNAGRVEAVANMLADEASKRVFLGMVKFRQTRDKRDFPRYEWRCAYFVSEFKPVEGEVFVDCGAFNGDSIRLFLKHCPNFKHITAFEPDARNFQKLNAKHGGNSNITLINAGVYDREGEVRFQTIGSAASHITDDPESASSIRVQTIDSLALEKVTFIKMDIEGAELNALRGAEKTILRDKPKLAVCIYHSNEDMLRIAEYIHGLAPEYKLQVRQHYCYPKEFETVLYCAIPAKLKRGDERE